MKVIEEERKILVKYIREKNTYSSKVCFTKEGYPFSHLVKTKGRIIGCLIAIDKNVIGWSLINKKDRRYSENVNELQQIYKKDKELAFNIAYNRALVSETLNDKMTYYLRIPKSIMKEFGNISNRSEKYYK